MYETLDKVNFAYAKTSFLKKILCFVYYIVLFLFNISKKLLKKSKLKNNSI